MNFFKIILFVTVSFYLQDLHGQNSPVINITPSGNTFDCDDNAGIVNELEALLLAGTSGGCAGPATSLDEFIILEDLSDPTTWTFTVIGCTGSVLFNVSFEDPCGNISPTATVIVDIIDTQPPVVIDVNGNGPLASGEVFILDCAQAPFTPPVVTSEDDCNGIVVHDSPLVISPVDCSQNLIWSYDDIMDPCGNILNYELEGEIGPASPLTNLRPDIGTGDCNVEFMLTEEQCSLMTPFCFPDPITWVNTVSYTHLTLPTKA